MSGTEADPQDLKKMSLEELANLRITFGEAMRGMTYQEALQTDPRYVSWFLARYQDSPKPAHRSFVEYLNRCIDEEEQNRQITKTGSPAKAKGYPNKSMPGPRPATSEELEGERGTMGHDRGGTLRPSPRSGSGSAEPTPRSPRVRAAAGPSGFDADDAHAGTGAQRTIPGREEVSADLVSMACPKVPDNSHGSCLLSGNASSGEKSHISRNDAILL